MRAEHLFDIDENPVSEPKTSRLSRAEWVARIRVRKAAETRQIEGLESQTIFKATVESKLLRAGAASLCASEGWTWFDNFLRCGVERAYVMCAICRHGHEVTYQCSQKWCPACNWKIAARRRALLEKMTAGIFGCKHVVLTRRNVSHMTHEEIQSDRKNLLRLRKQKIFGNVKGGCASLEFTNEDAGWHPHWHLLLQSSWIDAHKLSIAWGELVGQQFAIVKVMSVDEKSYLQELCKYVCSGAELASWTPGQILEFIIALQGTRMFTTFGTFKSLAKFARALIATEKEKILCEECGSEDKVFGQDSGQCNRIADKKGY
jgi:hypothetical protein